MGKTAGGEIMQWRYLDIRKITDSEYEQWYAMADESRRAGCDSCRSREDRLRAIAGDHLARLGIASHCGAAPEDIHFARTESGKPYAVGLNVHFNISHSGNYVVCAVSEDPVGIDVERIRPVRSKLTDKVCTPGELSYIREASGWGDELTGEAMVRFFRIWTSKEAWFKWAGTGITSLRSIDTRSRLGETFELDGHMVSICEA